MSAEESAYIRTNNRKAKSLFFFSVHISLSLAMYTLFPPAADVQQILPFNTTLLTCVLPSISESSHKLTRSLVLDVRFVDQPRGLGKPHNLLQSLSLAYCRLYSTATKMPLLTEVDQIHPWALHAQACQDLSAVQPRA